MKKRWMLGCLMPLLVMTHVAGCSDDSEFRCPPGQKKCGDGCVDVSKDRSHCGSCDNACATGQFCLEGSCMPCSDECTEGEKRCDPTDSINMFQVCGDPDNDTCWKWMAAHTCPAGQVCESGDCVANCDECSLGQRECSGNGWRQCGDWDADDCLEWSTVTDCASNETCNNGVCEIVNSEIVWIQIPGGTFMMGSDTWGAEAQPVHQVTVPTFDMTKSEVTVAQYQACVDASVCTAPNTITNCNWEVSARGAHPVNCVEWHQAVEFCTWAGGRLPSEAEWEYAARGRGQDIEYPWGDEIPTCQYAVMGEGGGGCGQERTWPVCSKPYGDTGQGLCDMAGNINEWVQDWHHYSYTGAPSDGSAWESPSSSHRVVRGGWWGSGENYLRASSRFGWEPSHIPALYTVGVRCGR